VQLTATFFSSPPMRKVRPLARIAAKCGPRAMQVTSAASLSAS
jgi:hypothetical protein